MTFLTTQKLILINGKVFNYLKHVQTFQLIENKNEWIVFGMEGKKEKHERKIESILQISSISYSLHV